MPARDIIVIGASAGSVQALRELCAALPADFPAAVFVVVHVSPTSVGMLPEILDAAGPLQAAHPFDGQPIERGRVYVAPPNRHMMIEDGAIRLTSGPKENGFRPAVDPLFRTAAAEFGRRVAGIVLSGGLDDGTEGLRRIKKRGGVAIVQDPEEAPLPGMPQSAIDNVDVDHILPTARIAEIMMSLARTGSGNGEKLHGKKMARTRNRHGADPAAGKVDSLRRREKPGKATPLTCPECGGVLWERGEKPVMYQCHVGHIYSEQGLLGAQSEEVEAALWTAVRALEESSELKRRMAQHARNGKLSGLAQQYERSASDARRHADMVRGALEVLPAPPAKSRQAGKRPGPAAPRRRRRRTTPP